MLDKKNRTITREAQDFSLHRVALKLKRKYYVNTYYKKYHESKLINLIIKEVRVNVNKEHLRKKKKKARMIKPGN